MVERDDDAPRKRIAVACGRCRKRKIRCSGDPGNGGPCSNCKNAGHEPCLFLRVSSTETHLRDGSGDYGYNVETARAYHARSSGGGGGGGGLSPLAAYNAMADAGAAAAYRQNSYAGYATGGKGYYSTAWTGAGGYPDDGGVAAAAEYGLSGYPPYATTAQLGQDPAEMYRYGSSTSSKAAAAAAAAAAGSVYVDPAEAAAASTYPYGSLVHRPAGAAVTAVTVGAAAVSSSDLPNFSLSSMAASLPSSQNSTGSSTSDRLPNPHRTLSSSSSVSAAYRSSNGLPPSSGSPYASKASTAAAAADVSGYGDYGESPGSYSTGASSTATLSGRSMSAQYPTTATAAEYGTADHHGGSYIYESKVPTSPLASPSPRRGSHQAAATLTNGHDYVPVSSHGHASVAQHPNYAGNNHDSSHYDVHHHHHHHHHSSHHRAHQQQDYDATGATAAGSGGGATSDGHGGRHHLRR
ncbi:hypothetical protein PG996_006593 [Apiospora saccharicola]|uniref:Zn(2)-C6 fungal-type domain-containing protein n=1 Tax=Apiospora saccharicola TaxID=335842 RepID=A0ABR1V8F0_9PEZI